MRDERCTDPSTFPGLGRTEVDPANPKTDLACRQGAAPIRGTTKRVIKAANLERPRGAWNTLELYCRDQRSVHVVNGQVVMRLSGIPHPTATGEMPVTRGRIQFQSEGGEVFFRNISIRRLAEMPER